MWVVLPQLVQPMRGVSQYEGLKLKEMQVLSGTLASGVHWLINRATGRACPHVTGVDDMHVNGCRFGLEIHPIHLPRLNHSKGLGKDGFGSRHGCSLYFAVQHIVWLQHLTCTPSSTRNVREPEKAGEFNQPVWIG